MNDSTELRCTLLNADSLNPGIFQTTRLTKAEIAQQYGVDGRELRNADLRSEGIPHILVRPSTIFLSIFTLRLLIQSDRVLVFLVDSEGDQEGAKTQDVFEHNLQSRMQVEQGSGFTPSLPFELRVVDAALASVTAILEAEHFILQGEVEKRLPESRREESVHLALRELLEHAKRLNMVEQHARQVRSALAELLNNDEDLALMYLSDRKAGKPHAIEDHQEVEYLLEAYYKNADAIAESASSLVGEVYRTARVTQSVLDVRRNQIMIFEAQLEIWMLGFAVSTFVAGLIGMNVINYMEETPYAFAWLVGGCMVTTLFISRLGMRKLRQFRKMHL
ncbi:Magnesium transporter MRS2/LPE10 [Penicillium malachiteum]|uniref:Magnesium transporter n=1 Tax=Penicillium malachiteum TaxID=1324776 RepID=A0AAD6HLR0_9EURO|nr:Magnesium transporter MRS2/LPE10 [Penicillium malachiteum]